MIDETKKEICWIYDQLGMESSIIPPDSSSATPGEMIITDHYNYVFGLAEIEEFVREVISTNELAYTAIMGRFEILQLKVSRLAKYFGSVDRFALMYMDEYEYSDYVKLFFYCYRKLEFGHEILSNPLGPTSSSCLQYERYHALINLIRESAATDAFKAAMSQSAQTAKRRIDSATGSINQVFNSHSKLLVIRLDLFYRKEYFREITAEQAKKDLSHFFWNWRHKKSLFGHCVYCCWKMEFGLQKGYHFHLVLFFNGRVVKNDVYYAHAVGEYWVNGITKGKGAFFSCNADKDKYRYLGIGMVKWDDEVKRRILIEKVVTYLAKSDQYLRAKRLRNSRCFGQTAVVKRSAAGRPRNTLI